MSRKTEKPSNYTCLHYCKINKALVPAVERVAICTGHTVPKTMVLLIEQGLENVGELYELHELSSIYIMTRTPGEKQASKQYKLWFQPEKLEAMKQLAKNNRYELKDVRTSLLLDGLTKSGVHLI